MDELKADFIVEASASLERASADAALLEANGVDEDALLRVVRALHTIKGAAGFLKFTRIAAIAHACEGALLRWREGRGAAETLALAHTALAQLSAILADIDEPGAEPEGDDSALIQALSETPNALDWAVELAAIRDRLLARANDALAALHALRPPLTPDSDAPPTPVEAAWKMLPALVADLSAELGKPMALTLEGGEVEIAAHAVAPVREALIHLVRNCADHGVETPAERKTQRKPQTAPIRVNAARTDDAIVIHVRDDGRGLDTAHIRHLAISQGLTFASYAARMTPEQINAFAFAPGLSTAARATALSGRGVGLDAVRAAIEALGGDVSLHSEPGRGADFTLRIPLAPAAPVVAAAPPAIAKVA